jgi:hypothetical protein
MNMCNMYKDEEVLQVLYIVLISLNYKKTNN